MISLSADQVRKNALLSECDSFGKLLCDWQIRKMVEAYKMIEDFVDHQVSKDAEDNPIISYGLSSAGYDMRVGRNFRIFTPSTGSLTCIDPKKPDERAMVDYTGDVCVIPPNSFALAHSLEYFRIPRRILAICLGKSTYARSGIVMNFTPFEPCYSDDTEILTPTGWKLLKDVSVGDLVFGLLDNGSHGYVPVEKKQEYAYSGELLHFSGRQLDLLVTPEHKVFVQTRTNGYNKEKEFTEWETVEAKKIFKKYNVKMTREVNWKGNDVPDSILIGSKMFDTNTFLRFLGAYLGDGYTYQKQGDYKVILCGKKERKREYFAKICSDMGVTFNQNDPIRTTFFSKDLCSVVSVLGKATEKYIPAWVKDLPTYRLKYILEGLMSTDGCEQTQTYTTSSKQLADDFQEIALKCGYGAILRTVHADTTQPDRKIKSKNDRYIIRLSSVQLRPKLSPKQQTLVEYSGFVYDVTVPNHLIYVRRNGKPVWSGNCWEGQVTIEISNTTPLPAIIYANEGIAQTLFFPIDPPEVSYADKKGKYMGQRGVTVPKV